MITYFTDGCKVEETDTEIITYERNVITVLSFKSKKHKENYKKEYGPIFRQLGIKGGWWSR